MSDPSLMSNPTTCEATPSVISSLESAGGVTPYDWLDGMMEDESGPEVALARDSPQPGDKKDLTIQDICGLVGSDSSLNAVLKLSLESRLKLLSDTAGSMLFKETWKAKTTPSGLSYWAHIASAHRTSDKDCISWPTPQAFDASNGGTPRPLRFKGNAPSEKGNTRDPKMLGSYRGDLKDHAGLAGWPTPLGVPDSPASHGAPSGPYRRAVIAASPWATPTTRDWKDGSECLSVPENSLLGRQVWQTGWPTPKVSDDNSDRMGAEATLREWNRPNASQSNLPLVAKVLGPLLNGSPAETENLGQLNPAFSRWLMGYPIEWDVCAGTVTRLSRRLRKPLSKATVSVPDE